MISRIFIDRPIFAWVLAIIVMVSGLVAVRFLPVAQYPDVAPPQVTIHANYPGASATTIQNSVTQVLEQSLTGIDGLLYFSSTSSSKGEVSIAATFAKGTVPDVAQMQVQNAAQQALSRLPAPVQQQGLLVRKSNPDDLMVVAVYDETDRMTNRDVSDYLTSNLQDSLSRIQGVGATNVFGSPHAMRIWLNPQRLAAFAMMPSDIVAAIKNQNAEVAAGELGGLPQPAGQLLNASVTSQSRLQTPAEFAAIVIKVNPDGGTVRLSDVARIELGSESYNISGRLDHHPAAGISILMAPGSDALKTAGLIKAEVARLSNGFPPGLKVIYANDTSPFIKLSIDEVVKTLIEAIVLVVVVMFVFLQNWRATLVPAIAVPIVMLGTFAVLYVAGFSINTLTLFGLVLAIGLLVDDAIVVVENVERMMRENPGMSARDATIRSMNEISVALIAIALVLSAVFLPMALFGGSTGVIYRQFSITVVSAMVLSVLVALVLSPALTSTLLKPHDPEAAHRPSSLTRRFPALGRARIFVQRQVDRFNQSFETASAHYQRSVAGLFDRRWLFLAIYAGVIAIMAVLFVRLPTGFLPLEDQGRATFQWRLPAGATLSRTIAVQKQIEAYFAKAEPDNVQTIYTVSGGGGTGQNNGQGFLNFADWSARQGKANTADAIAQRATEAFKGVRDAQVTMTVPAAVRGLGASNGFTMELQNTGGLSTAAFKAARDQLLDAATNDPALSGVRLTNQPDVSSLKVNTDAQKLAALGLSQSDVNATLSTAWGGSYVNDFIDQGRVKKVYVQGEAPYRAQPSDIGQWHVRGTTGQMTPFSAFASTSWSQTPALLSRFNGTEAFEFQGQAAPGHSSGEAMNRMEALTKTIPGVGVAWAGLSYQERLSSGQAPYLYALSLLVVFLCLAALYESWSIPLAVLLVIPLGVVGAVAAVTLRGLTSDVYFQIGLLTTMGLAAKNAILIVEFAEAAEKRGKSPLEAAAEAARLRLRPIIMTSLAFIFGVLPLALSTGPGANSRIAIGTAVVGGMLTATMLAIFYIPLFFVLVRTGLRGLRKGRAHTPPAAPATEAP